MIRNYLLGVGVALSDLHLDNIISYMIMIIFIFMQNSFSVMTEPIIVGIMGAY